MSDQALRSAAKESKELGMSASSSRDASSSIPHAAFRNPVSTDAPRLKVVFVGHVDHGKSTLIGRILTETGSLPDGKIDMIKKACAAEGMEFEFAFLLDALLEEQKQNV